MSEKNSDIIYGITNESKLLDILKKTLPHCENISKTKNEYHPIDFQSDETNCELKSRKIKHDAFDTALINVSKIEFMKRDGKEHNYLVWQYTDGIYYLKVDYTFFDMLDIHKQIVKRDGKSQINDVYEIHHTHLTRL